MAATSGLAVILRDAPLRVAPQDEVGEKIGPRARAIFDRAATKQPDGQILTFLVGQITFMTPDILSLRKGRWPSSRTLGRDAVDAAASCARWDCRAGFRARERSKCVLTSGAEAYGEVVWS